MAVSSGQPKAPTYRGSFGGVWDGPGVFSRNGISWWLLSWTLSPRRRWLQNKLSGLDCHISLYGPELTLSQHRNRVLCAQGMLGEKKGSQLGAVVLLLNREPLGDRGMSTAQLLSQLPNIKFLYYVFCGWGLGTKARVLTRLRQTPCLFIFLAARCFAPFILEMRQAT